MKNFFIFTVLAIIVARPFLPPPVNGGDIVVPVPGTACVAVNWTESLRAPAGEPEGYFSSAFTLFGWEPEVPPELRGKEFIACPAILSPESGIGPARALVGIWLREEPVREIWGDYAREA